MITEEDMFVIDSVAASIVSCWFLFWFFKFLERTERKCSESNGEKAID